MKRDDNKRGSDTNLHGGARSGAPGGAGSGERGGPGGPPMDKKMQALQKQGMRAQGAAGGRPGGFRGGGHGAAIETPQNFGGAIKRLIAYFGKQWPSLIVVGVAIIASAGVKAIAPARIGLAIRQHIEIAPDAALFVEEMLVVLAIYAGSWIADGLSGVFMARAGNRLVFRMRQDIFDHLQSLSMSFFDRRGIGDIISRATNDIEMVYNALTNGFTGLLTGVFSIFGVLIAMLVLDIRMSLVVFAILPVIIVVTAVIGRLVRKAFRLNQRLVGALSGKIAESISTVKVIKSFHKEQATYEEFVELSNKAKEAGERAEIVSFALHPIMRFINGLTLALVVGVGGVLVIGENGYSIGLLTAFILYARRFFEPLRQMTNVYNLIQSALAGAERVFEIMDTEPAIVSAPDAIRIDDIKGDVEFKNVEFGYLPDQRVVENINLSVKSGQVTAIVGPTGAGKTTLVNLLSRFYDVRQGSISIDGTDIRKLDVDSLRKRMGVVLQEPYFFATTIIENILYGNTAATGQQAIEAAKIARADEFIRKLPDGYDTKLQERGLNLSQGERQLLAIARAVLADPKILILDEATSSVDSLTETLIQQGLLELMKGRTSFIIAHRLSTIRKADQVIVLHDRGIIERGTHQELMEKEGFYARLYRMQFETTEITEDMEI